MRVTFDTNVFDKVTRPAVYPNDPDLQAFMVIHEAVKDGRAFISDTTVTLEGIGNDDRTKPAKFLVVLIKDNGAPVLVPVE
ncbi:MAG: hypothetical protein JO223_17535 [Hyphomicrobiales bacterium]|nr:hypothetical protein [Hyphomicrobiales bacterium]MBV8440541.1 hypothetical protein [Hyphomicrobiales bacterium]